MCLLTARWHSLGHLLCLEQLQTPFFCLNFQGQFRGSGGQPEEAASAAGAGERAAAAPEQAEEELRLRRERGTRCRGPSAVRVSGCSINPAFPHNCHSNCLKITRLARWWLLLAALWPFNLGMGANRWSLEPALGPRVPLVSRRTPVGLGG